MKQLITLTLFYALLLTQIASARTVEIEVHGMTCAFCVDSLERRFEQMDSVSKVQVSLKMKKVRLETDENSPSIEFIHKTVLDTGFTPVKITVLTDEERKN